MIARFFGFLLRAMGVLIMGLSGLCSGAAVLSGDAGILPLVLVFGGVPFAVGWLFWSVGSDLMGKQLSGEFMPSAWIDDDSPPPPDEPPSADEPPLPPPPPGPRSFGRR